MTRLVAISIAALAISACGPGAPPAPAQSAATGTPSAPLVTPAPAPGAIPISCAELQAAIAMLGAPKQGLIGESILEADQDFYSENRTTFTLPGASQCVAYSEDGGSFGFNCEWPQADAEAANAAQRALASTIAACLPAGTDIPDTARGWTRRTVSAEHPDWTVAVYTSDMTHDQELASYKADSQESEDGDAPARPVPAKTPVVRLALHDEVTACEDVTITLDGAVRRLKEISAKPAKARRIDGTAMLGALDLCSESIDTGGIITCIMLGSETFAQVDAESGKCLAGWTRKVIPTENFIGGSQLGQSIEYTGAHDGTKLAFRLFEEKSPEPSRMWREIRLQ